MRLPGGEKYVVGYDIGDTYVQISYANMNNNNVETISSVAGEEIYTIPAMLCKKPGTNQWSYGREALKCAEEEQGILIEHLFELAVDGEPILIQGESFDPVVLFTMFVKKTFSLLSQAAGGDRIVAVAFTCGKMETRVREVLQQVARQMRLKEDRVFFKSHQESFYHYMRYQPEDLVRFQTLLMEYRKKDMLVYRMERNLRTDPTTVYVEEIKYPFPAYEPLPEEEEVRQEAISALDREFLDLAAKTCENRMISSVYLIGEGFAEEWLKDSLRYLCRGRRVFLGNNLYSKGACYGLLEHYKGNSIAPAQVFLGDDKLKVNIGMLLSKGGQTTYCSLLEAGANWYEAECSREIYLQEGNCIEVQLAYVLSEERKTVSMSLDGLPEGISRLGVQLYMEAADLLVLEIEDLGFGQFREATHQVWADRVRI